MTEILNTTPEENLNMIKDTVSYLKAWAKAIYDMNIFDGYKTTLITLMIFKAACEGGEILALCDTNGGCFPHEIYDITKTVMKNLGCYNRHPLP